MQNVIVSMKKEVLAWVRAKAARGNASVSRFVGALVEQAQAQESSYERAMRSALKFKPLTIAKGGRRLTRIQANDRMQHGQRIEGVQIVSPFKAAPGS